MHPAAEVILTAAETAVIMHPIIDSFIALTIWGFWKLRTKVFTWLRLVNFLIIAGFLLIYAILGFVTKGTAYPAAAPN